MPYIYAPTDSGPRIILDTEPLRIDYTTAIYLTSPNDAVEVTTNPAAPTRPVRVEVSGDGYVIAGEGTRITTYGATVIALAGSTVTAFGSAYVWAIGAAQVIARDSAQVLATGSAEVELRDAASVTARNMSQVKVGESAVGTVVAYDMVRVKSASPAVSVRMDGQSQFTGNSGESFAAGSSQVQSFNANLWRRVENAQVSGEGARQEQPAPSTQQAAPAERPQTTQQAPEQPAPSEQSQPAQVSPEPPATDGQPNVSRPAEATSPQAPAAAPQAQSTPQTAPPAAPEGTPARPAQRGQVRTFTGGVDEFFTDTPGETVLPTDPAETTPDETDDSGWDPVGLNL